MKRKFMDSPLGQVHYIDAGNATGCPIILTHQTPRSSDEFADVIPVLSRTFRVIAIDMPGYGDSDKPKTQPTVKEYTNILLLLMDHLGFQQAHLVGHHTGSFLAIEMAATHPERVAKLVISGPHYMDEDERQKCARTFKQWKVQADGSHLTEKWNRFRGWIENPHIAQRCLLDLLKAGETSEFGHFSCAKYKMEDRLPLVKGPALIIIGKKDPFSYTDKCRNFAKTIPGAREVFLDDGGIFMPTEMPETYAELVVSFLSA